MKWVGILFGVVILSLLGFSYNAYVGSSNKVDPSSSIYLRSIYSIPQNFDPSQMNEGAALIFAETVYEGLVRLDDNFGVRAGIASEWKTSPDGKSISFTLNPKARFHNGESVRARDVIASLKNLLKQESLVQKTFDNIKGAKDFIQNGDESVLGLRAIDSQSLVIELEKPQTSFLYLLAGATSKILPEAYIKNNDFSKPAPGAGPFRVVGINDQQISLEAFSRYHGKEPLQKKMKFLRTTQQEGEQLAREGVVHDLSVWPLTGSEKIFEFGLMVKSVNLETWIIGFNTRISPLGSRSVRSYLKGRFDSEAFRKKFYPSALPAHGYIPPGLPGHVDQEKAVGIQSPQPVEFSEPIKIMVPLEITQSQEIVTFINNQFRGLPVSAQTMTWSKMMELYNKRKLQAFLISMNMDYPDSEFLLNNFHSKSSDNFSGIDQPEIDRLIEKSKVERIREKRFGLQKSVVDKISQEALSINIFHPSSHYWVHKCVRGFKPNLTGMVYIDYREIYLSESCLKDLESK